MKTSIKFLTKCAVLLLICQNLLAATSKDIVDGFSEFLIERANANLVAIFERRLKNDERFQCYFPNTHEKIDHISLDNLFSSKSYWESGLEADLEILIYRSMYRETLNAFQFLNKPKIKQWLNRDKAIETMQMFEYVNGGQPHPISAPIKDLSDPLSQEINGFTALTSSIEAVRKIKTGFFESDVCGDLKKQTGQYRQKFSLFAKAADELVVWVDHIRAYGGNLNLSKEGRQRLVCQPKGLTSKQCELLEIDEKSIIADLFNQNFSSELKTAKETAQRIANAYRVLQQFIEKEKDTIDEIQLLISTLKDEKLDKKKIKEILKLAKELTDEAKISKEQREKANKFVEVNTDTTETTVVRRQLIVESLTLAKAGTVEVAKDVEAKKAFELLRSFIDGKSLQSYTDRALVSLELLEDSRDFDSSKFGRLRNSVMFFASIADASDKEGVKAILTAYTLPPVSYAEKRKQGAGFFVSAYLGMAAADFDEQGSSEEASGSGLFAPVGLEWNYGTDDGGSWSIMLSPIDMGYPINLKLNGIEEDVELDELVAPSLTFAYGFADYPINLGIGYQRGRTLEDVEKAEEGVLLFLSFDMPLLQLF